MDKQWVPDGSTGKERFELDLSAKGYRIHNYLVIVLEDFDCNRAWTSAMDTEVAFPEADSGEHGSFASVAAKGDLRMADKKVSGQPP